jgi:hypothetical protein
MLRHKCRIIEGMEWIPSVCCQSKETVPSEPPTDSPRRYPLPNFTYSAYDVAYTQFRQDHFGLREDGAPESPKHVGASWYFKYMVYFEKCISLDFFIIRCLMMFTLRAFPLRFSVNVSFRVSCIRKDDGTTPLPYYKFKSFFFYVTGYLEDSGM